jgi:hypothetical protein
MTISVNQKRRKNTVIKSHGDYYEKNRKKSMSYKDFLSQKIAELEKKIESATGEKQALQSALNELKLKEFEEDMRTEGTQQLLKG